MSVLYMPLPLILISVHILLEIFKLIHSGEYHMAKFEYIFPHLLQKYLIFILSQNLLKNEVHALHIPTPINVLNKTQVVEIPLTRLVP